jgi:hypothetical protein
MDNMLVIVLITVLATIAVMGVGFVCFKAKKDKGGSFEQLFPEVMEKARPILSDLFINLFTLYDANKGGFDGLMNFAVNYVKDKVDAADFLTDKEKELLTKEFITTMIQPTLLKLYNQKISK